MSDLTSMSMFWRSATSAMASRTLPSETSRGTSIFASRRKSGEPVTFLVDSVYIEWNENDRVDDGPEINVILGVPIAFQTWDPFCECEPHQTIMGHEDDRRVPGKCDNCGRRLQPASER